MQASKMIVTAFLDAMNIEDYTKAATYVTDDMQFIGVMGQRDGAAAYFKDIEKMKLKYQVKKVFEDGDDVCVFYDIDMSGKNIFASGWYHLTNHKIDNFKVIFDPRPLLDGGNKK